MKIKEAIELYLEPVEVFLSSAVPPEAGLHKFFNEKFICRYFIGLRLVDYIDKCL
jgi:hypothetical protein